MMNEKNGKCGIAFQIIVIILLSILFLCSFTYTLAVYFSVGKEAVEKDLGITELCRPYFDVSQPGIPGSGDIPQTGIPGAGDIPQTGMPGAGSIPQTGTSGSGEFPPIGIPNLSSLPVEDLYNNYPKCVDVLVPVICQLQLPLGVSMPNTELLLECNGVIEDETLHLLAQFPTVYYENVTCADGFYRLKYTCRPHCTEFEQIDHKDAQIKIGFLYFATIFNLTFTALFIITVCFKRKTVFKFPSILFVYIVVLYSIWPASILINLLSGRTLFCSDDDLVKSLEEPTPYCIISGILNAVGIIATWLWFVFVAVMFWKLLFPINAHRHNFWEKWIHMFALVFAAVYLIPFVIITTVSEDFYFIQNEFPSFFCLSRHADFTVLYQLFPAVFLCSLGVFLLLILLIKIQMKYGCSIWRNNEAIDTAEKKILLLLCFLGTVTTLSGIYYTLLISGGKHLEAGLQYYLLCELPGYIMDNENDVTTCSKDDLERYSYTSLSIAFIVFTYGLLPLVSLLVIIEWRHIISKIKDLLHIKSDDFGVSNHLSRLHSNSGLPPSRLNSSSEPKTSV